MSKPINDGGGAFPGPSDYRQDGSPIYMGQTGMTLRDYFAGQALAGWLASYGENMEHPSANGTIETVAKHAYEMADAMLAARSKEGREP